MLSDFIRPIFTNTVKHEITNNNRTKTKQRRKRKKRPLTILVMRYKGNKGREGKWKY